MVKYTVMKGMGTAMLIIIEDRKIDGMGERTTLGGKEAFKAALAKEVVDIRPQIRDENIVYKSNRHVGYEPHRSSSTPTSKPPKKLFSNPFSISSLISAMIEIK